MEEEEEEAEEDNNSIHNRFLLQPPLFIELNWGLKCNYVTNKACGVIVYYLSVGLARVLYCVNGATHYGRPLGPGLGSGLRVGSDPAGKPAPLAPSTSFHHLPLSSSLAPTAGPLFPHHDLP